MSAELTLFAAMCIVAAISLAFLAMLCDEDEKNK